MAGKRKQYSPEFKFKVVLESLQRDPKSRARAHGYEPGESPDELKRLIGDLTVQNELLW